MHVIYQLVNPDDTMKTEQFGSDCIFSARTYRNNAFPDLFTTCKNHLSISFTSESLPFVSENIKNCSSFESNQINK